MFGARTLGLGVGYMIVILKLASNLNFTLTTDFQKWDAKISNSTNYCEILKILENILSQDETFIDQSVFRVKRVFMQKG